MRVLHIINNLQPAGAEMLVRDLTVRLGQRGWATEVYLLHSTGSWLEIEVRRSVATYSGGTGSVYSPHRFFQLVRFLKANSGRYDLIHVHLFPAQLFVACAATLSLTDAPIVATEHSTVNRRRNYGWIRPLDRWMYRQFAMTTGVSGAVSNNLTEWLGHAAGATVWNGVDVERFQNADRDRLKQELDTSLPLALMVGRFHRQKDQATAIRALTHCANVGLVLAGDGPELTACTRLATELNVAERVWFVGQRKDIPELIAGSDVYVQCSHAEGFGIAVVEAMAGGLPVIGTDVDGLRQVVGDAGRYFQPGDHRALASSILEVLRDQTLRSELKTRSVSRAQQFHISRTVDRYCQLYEQVLQSVPRELSSPTLACRRRGLE